MIQHSLTLVALVASAALLYHRSRHRLSEQAAEELYCEACSAVAAPDHDGVRLVCSACGESKLTVPSDHVRRNQEQASTLRNRWMAGAQAEKQVPDSALSALL